MEILTVAADTQKLDQVASFLDSFLEARGCSVKAQMQIGLSAEEIFVNIANDAYPNGPGEAQIGISEENGVAEITFTDSGVPYDPLAKPDPDVTLSAEDRAVGGLGIFLVKKNMDTVSYRYEDGKNILTVTKRIRP